MRTKPLIAVGGAVAVALSFLLAAPALAAGTVTVEQVSSLEDFGSWRIHRTLGVDVVGSEQSRTLSLEEGSYTLSVTDDPEGASRTTTVSHSGVLVLSTTDALVPFSVRTAEPTKITITYRYNGVVRVDSEPRGQSFELRGGAPNARYTGVTPAVFEGMPPLQYRVTFERKEGCAILPQQSRILRAGQTISFLGRYECASEEPTVPEEPEAPTPPAPEPSARAQVRLWVTAGQTEALPGASVPFTITVRNTGERALQNLMVSAEFDPQTMQTSGAIPMGGQEREGFILWNLPALESGRTWTLELPMQLSADVKQGAAAALNVNVLGEDLAAPEGRSVAVGVTGLPQTGVGFDALFLAVSGVLSLATAAGLRRKVA